MMTAPGWQKALLDEGELYAVGGAVRDELLGVSCGPHEVDYLVRGIPPERLEELLARFGRVELVGKSFGVYKFRPRGSREVFDVAYPRRERSLGPGHRDFAVDWDWRLGVEDDLGRRDFTVNAMARDVRDGRLVDPHGGRRDVEDRVLRSLFPGAFEEDPLRILRGVRFAACLSLDVDPGTEAAMRTAAPLLDTVSAERVQGELTKLLERCQRPGGAFVRMHELGALARILPELDRCAGVTQNEYHPDDVFVHSIKTCDMAPRDNLAVRWAALLHDVGKVDAKRIVADEKLGDRVVFYGHQAVSAEIAARVLRRLRYAKDFVERCAHLVRHHMFNYEPAWRDATVRRFIRRVGRENLEDLFALRRADAASRGTGGDGRDETLSKLEARVRREIDRCRVTRVTDLAVDGRDVMRECGIPGGPGVGRVLDELLEAVLDDPALNERETLLEMLRRRGAGGN